MKVDMDSLDAFHSYRLFRNCVAPRPIAWVSTVGENGVFNVAPFSFFSVASCQPPIVCFSVIASPSGKKDTVRNIECNGEFVINMVEEPLAEKMNITAKDFPPEISEFTEAGLTPAPSDLIKVPRIAQSPVNMECRLHQIIEFGEGTTSFILGEVLRVHVDDALWVNGKVNVGDFHPLGRMGDDVFCRTLDTFIMKRLKYTPTP